MLKKSKEYLEIKKKPVSLHRFSKRAALVAQLVRAHDC